MHETTGSRRRYWQRYLVPSVAVVLGLASMPANPAQEVVTVSAVMPVRIEIIATCTLSISDLNFNNYTSSASAALRGQTLIQANCSPGNTAELSLDAGTAPSATTSSRALVSGDNLLKYDLYQDSGLTAHWGDTSGVNTLEFLTLGVYQSFTVYGAIPAAQVVPAGTYGDVITVRVLF